MSNVRTDFRNAKGVVKKLNDRKVQYKVAEVITSYAKRLIASGQSPLQGDGRYAKYLNEERYPGNRKPRRPVNLNLTGKMLRYLKTWIGEGGILRYGFRAGDTPEDVMTRAKAHQDGTETIVARPMVPTHGRKFAVSIQKAIRDVYTSALRDILRMSK